MLPASAGDSPARPLRAAGGQVRAQRRTAGRLPVVLATATVGAQIAYPLTSGEPLRRLTVVTVLLFAAASAAHALATRGARWTAVLLTVTVGGGLAAESLGVATGWPFGRYAYADTLGPKLLGVPVVIPLAWSMLAYPAFLAARRLQEALPAGGRGDRPWRRARDRLAVPLLGGVGLASWDLFLDPQMVAAGHWSWADPTPALPGVPGVPLTNYAGWLLVGVVMMALLDALLPRVASDGAAPDDRVPAALYLWTYASSVLGAAVFFGRPVVALLGGLAMGLVVVPYAFVLWRSR